MTGKAKAGIWTAAIAAFSAIAIAVVSIPPANDHEARIRTLEKWQANAEGRREARRDWRNSRVGVVARDAVRVDINREE
jgi:hypothetical protein